MTEINYEDHVSKKRKQAYREATTVFKKYLEKIESSEELNTYELRQFDVAFKKKANLLGVSEKELLEQCKSAELLQSVLFHKDPAKQSIHQELAVDFLKKAFKAWPGFCNFELLKSSGPYSLYVSKGVVVGIDGVETGIQRCKSIDFKWEFKHRSLKENIVFYGSHKYTKEDGGSQDNQRKDLISFIEETAGNKNKNAIFFVIPDGAYYEKSIKTAPQDRHARKPISRLDEMRELSEKIGTCHVATSKNLIEECVKVVGKIFKENNMLSPFDNDSIDTVEKNKIVF